MRPFKGIFTTAQLWVTDHDPSSARLDDGKCDLAGEPLSVLPWLYYYYHQSPALLHSVRPQSPAVPIDKVLYSEYVRAIAIVNGASVAEFLSMHHWHW